LAGTLIPEPGHTVLPPEDRSALRSLASFVQSHRQPATLTGPDGECVDLPEAIYTVLANVVQAMESGRAITVAPTSTRFTTQAGADLLGVSRPTLLKLLESGRIRTSGRVVTAAYAWWTCSPTATLPGRRWTS